MCDRYGSKHKRKFKDEESIKILKILGLINNTDECQNSI